jgi:hypothetical protein
MAPSARYAEADLRRADAIQSGTLLASSKNNATGVANRSKKK